MYFLNHITWLQSRVGNLCQLTPRLKLHLHLVWRKTYTSYRGDSTPRVGFHIHEVMGSRATSYGVSLIPHTTNNWYSIVWPTYTLYYLKHIQTSSFLLIYNMVYSDLNIIFVSLLQNPSCFNIGKGRVLLYETLYLIFSTYSNIK